MCRKALIKTAAVLGIFMPLIGGIWNEQTREASANRSFLEGSPIPTAPQYFKPVNPSAPRSPTTTTGTRRGGCFESKETPFLLAPARFIGKTTTASPTFTWFLPDDAPVPVEFSLYALQPTGALELRHSESLIYGPGFRQYQLPDEAAMETNQSYMWQLILHCNPNRPSQSLVYEAEVAFVPDSQTLTSMITPTGQSRVLAEAGYWYDAIAVLGTDEAPDITQMRNILMGDLAFIEETLDNSSPVE